MNLKYLANVRIGHALLFAAAILFSAIVLADTEHHQTISYLILVLWFVSSLLLPGTGRRIKCEWTCLRRFLSSNNSTTNG